MFLPYNNRNFTLPSFFLHSFLCLTGAWCLTKPGSLPLTGKIAPSAVYLTKSAPNICIMVVDGNASSLSFSSANSLKIL